MKIHPAAAELKWSPVQKECKVDDDADDDGAVDVAHVGDGNDSDVTTSTARSSSASTSPCA